MMRMWIVGVAVSCLLCFVVGESPLECTNVTNLVVDSGDMLANICRTNCKVVEEEEEEVDRNENLGIAFGLVIAAGFSTSIGAALVFFNNCVKKTNKLVLAASLGFSGGVMLYVSLVEIFLKAVDEFTVCDCLWEHDDPSSPAKIVTTLCFFGGIIIFMLLDLCVHALHDMGQKQSNATACEKDKPSHSSTSATNEQDGELTIKDDDESNVEESVVEEVGVKTSMKSPPICVCCDEDAFNLGDEGEVDRLHNMGILTAVAIALHNFPEGLATFVATLADPAVGAGLAVAIAIHNVPEGLCVSIPIYYATGSRWKGFILATLSGLAEVVGALLGYAFLMSVMGSVAYGILFGVVAGMMVAIVLKELIPTGHRYDPKDKVVTHSVFIGMIVMAISLCLFLI